MHLWLVPSTASVPLPRYAAFIHYIQHLLKHIVDMPYISNSWNLKEIKDELKKRNKQRARMKKARLRPELHLSAPSYTVGPSLHVFLDLPPVYGYRTLSLICPVD